MNLVVAPGAHLPGADDSVTALLANPVSGRGERGLSSTTLIQAIRAFAHMRKKRMADVDDYRLPNVGVGKDAVKDCRKQFEFPCRELNEH